MTHIKTWLDKLHHLSFPKQLDKLPKKSVTLAEIKIDWLKAAGIRGVILDLDNTIISEDDLYLSPWAEDWIAEAKLADLKLFILSNGKRRYRVKYWSYRLNIAAISPARKPFPPAFRKAMNQMRLSSKNIVVIGDSLHTDIMGAKLCGCRCIQVASLPHPRRWWEKLAGKWVQIPYPSERELWDFAGAFGYKIFS